MAKKSAKTKTKTKRIELKMDELEAILERAKSSPLASDDVDTLRAVFQTLQFVTDELDKKGASIRQLRKMLFGPTSEKMSKIFGEKNDEGAGAGADDGAASDADAKATNKADASSDSNDKAKGSSDDKQTKPKAPGHGRNGADAYPGAETIEVPHPTLKHGDPCPECPKGKVYDQTPRVIVRVTGGAPLPAKRYKLGRLRCNLCGTIFNTAPPEGVDPNKKYDEKAAAMIALLKYANGMPFNRLAGLQGSLGIPLPPSTQWDIVSPLGFMLKPVFDALAYEAAQGDVLYNDDTPMKVLSLMKTKE